MFKFPENCNLHTFFQVAASSCSRFNKFQKSSLQGILASNSSLFHGIENINRYSKNAGDTHYVQKDRDFQIGYKIRSVNQAYKEQEHGMMEKGGYGNDRLGISLPFD